MTYKEALKAGGQDITENQDATPVITYEDALKAGGKDVTTIPEFQPIKKQTSVDIVKQALESIPGSVKMAQQKQIEMIKNIPESTINLIKNTAGAFIHPIQTGKGLLKLATLDDTAWSQIANFYKERYGGFKELENTIIKDPVGFATDVSTMLSVVGGITKLTGKGISKVTPKPPPGQLLLPPGKPRPGLPPGQGFTMKGKPYSKVTMGQTALPAGTTKKLLTMDFGKKSYTAKEILEITKKDLPDIPFIKEKLKVALETKPFLRTAEQKVLLKSIGEGGYITIPGVSDISATLQKTGQTLSEAGKAIDPFRAIGKTITWTGQKASDVAANILGMTTGTGKAAIKQAFKGGEEFKKGLRGKIDAQMVLDNAVDALDEVKQTRRTAYQTQLAGIKSKANVVIDKKPVFNQLKISLKSFNIETYLDDAGELVIDTSQSGLDRSVRGAVSDLIKDVLQWKDWSPQGADILKQRIDDFYAPTKNSRAIVSPLRNSVKQAIIKQVPEYSKMVKDYEIMSGHIEDITKTLLSGKKDTALRRLNTIFRDVNEYRQAVLGKLDTLTDSKLTEQLAGVALSANLPRGWPSKVVPSVGAGTMAFYSPAIAAGIAISASPRLMGEIALKAGQAGRGAGQAGKALLPHWKYLYQAGRTRELLEKKRK